MKKNKANDSVYWADIYMTVAERILEDTTQRDMDENVAACACYEFGSLGLNINQAKDYLILKPKRPAHPSWFRDFSSKSGKYERDARIFALLFAREISLKNITF